MTDIQINGFTLSGFVFSGISYELSLRIPCCVMLILS